MNARASLHRSDLRAYWKHLRVPFQLSLAPLFLWGYFLASLNLTPAFVLGFVAFHLCLYTGITAFNSAYDRDKGPVGGMLAPPPVPSGLLAFSLVVQAVGAVLAAGVNRAFLAIYLIIAAMGAAYSHPRTRWKAHPVASAATVFIGQGALGFLAGWAAASGGIVTAWSERGLWGMLSAAFTTLGLYPLTQVYQIEEDAARGDRTLAVVLGPAGALRFGLFCLALAGTAAILVMARTSTPLDTALVAAAYSVILAQVARFAQAYMQHRHTVISAFRTAMRLNFLTSAGFLLFIALHLARLL
ncbi:MAG TPA: UbiA family prenyltransferase [Chthonomonadaceae bacterium]|nr:UbiA family prenyltransferase [Chthonomonadaceae bacterium]